MYKYLLLFFIMGISTLWIQLIMTFSTRSNSKKGYYMIRDTELLKIIQTKTNLKMEAIHIAHSNRLFGQMVGLPGKPLMILSEKVYKTFSKEKLEYVILHEAGHYKLAHSLREALFFIISFFIGCYFINGFILIEDYLIIITVGFLLGILNIKHAQIHEYEADRFALTRIKDPKGMISATQKFQKAFSDMPSYKSLLGILFYRGVPYHKRIELAQNEIDSRRTE